MLDASCYTLSQRKQSTGYNSTYPKGGFSCSKKSFVVNQTLVFQNKFCGKSSALRVAVEPCTPILGRNRTKPVFKKNQKGFAFVITAEFDPLRDQGFAYAKRLEKEGVPTKYKDLKGCIHVMAGPFMEEEYNQLNNEIAIELEKLFK